MKLRLIDSVLVILRAYDYHSIFNKLSKIETDELIKEHSVTVDGTVFLLNNLTKL